MSQVIIRPVVTEKSVQVAEKNNQHTLYVHADATKDDVKTALKKYFGVNAASIKMVKMPQKIRVRSKYGPQVKRKPRKKAIVCLPEGVSLDLLKMTSAPKGAKGKKTTSKKTATKSTSEAKEKTSINA